MGIISKSHKHVTFTQVYSKCLNFRSHFTCMLCNNLIYLTKRQKLCNAHVEIKINYNYFHRSFIPINVLRNNCFHRSFNPIFITMWNPIRKCPVLKTDEGNYLFFRIVNELPNRTRNSGWDLIFII